jgi:hypothetical protein
MELQVKTDSAKIFRFLLQQVKNKNAHLTTLSRSGGMRLSRFPKKKLLQLDDVVGHPSIDVTSRNGQPVLGATLNC